MSIIWAGQEDMDFPNGTGSPTISTSASFRTGYARCSLQPANTGQLKSMTFGSPVAGCWLSARISATSTFASAIRMIGLGKSGVDSGLFVGTSGSVSGQFALWKKDAGSYSSLATEAGASWSNGIRRIDMQLINYGASATVLVYLDLVQIINFSGSVAATGVSNLDQVWIPGTSLVVMNWSEVVVADEDTRPMLGLLTMAPGSAGTTNSWTNNTYTNVSPTTINDANAAYTNTGAQDQQYNLTDEPGGAFLVKAVKVAARAWMTSGATATKIKLGFNSGGSVAVGSAQSVSTGATTYEQIWNTNNPVTGAAWGDATEINALQVDLQSST